MDAEDGMKFMQEMIEFSKNQHNEGTYSYEFLKSNSTHNRILLFNIFDISLHFQCVHFLKVLLLIYTSTFQAVDREINKMGYNKIERKTKCK